jgi:replication factor C subunit 3/5
MSKRSRVVSEEVDENAVMSTTPSSLPLIEKYRPETLDQVVAQHEIVSTISRLMESNQLPHLLFYGPAGVGKTSTVLAMAKKMYGTSNMSAMVLELNASDARGIDDIREEVVTFAGTKRLFSSGMKLVILDEADNMTKDAQFALRRVIEKYTATTRFCLICNYVSKIIPALQSRCTRFRFAPLNPEHIKSRLQDICAKEKIATTADGIEALLKLGGGDMRKVLNLLEASAMQHQPQQQQTVAVVDSALVYSVAGKPTKEDIDRIVHALFNESVTDCVRTVASVQLDKGLALTDIVSELHKSVRAMVLPNPMAHFLLRELADVEYRLASATDDKLQLAGLVAVFQLAKKLAEGGE